MPSYSREESREEYIEKKDKKGNTYLAPKPPKVKKKASSPSGRFSYRDDGVGNSSQEDSLYVDEVTLSSSALSSGGVVEAFGFVSEVAAGLETLDVSPTTIKSIAPKVIASLAVEENPGIPEEAKEKERKKRPGFVGALIDDIKRAGGFLGNWILSNPLKALAIGAGVVVVGGVVTAGVMAGGALLSGGIAGLLGLSGLWATVVNGVGAIFTAAMIPSLCQWIVQGVQELWTFNWNITDEELDKEVQNAFDSIYGILGDMAGSIVGQACGIIPGVVSVWVNPRLMNQIKTHLGEHAYDKVIGELYAIFGWAKQVVQKWLFAKAYGMGRKIIKKIVRNSSAIQELLGEERTKAITETWGSKGAKPWTFAQQYEEWVDSIEDRRVKAFVESFVERTMESCGESLMVWANAVA